MVYDVIVIGIGLAGLSAALRLAQAGARVLILAKGIGGTHLDSGTIDVLGYDNELVTNPTLELEKFLKAYPGHPYAKAHSSIVPALEWFMRLMEGAGYPFVGDPNKNFLLPSAIGAARPTCLLPRTMQNGDLRKGGNLVVVGLRNLKDFYPGLCAKNLVRQCHYLGIDFNARFVTIKPPDLERADASPIDIARAFDRESFRSKIAALLRPLIGKGEAVGLPALLGLEEPASVWRDLESRLDTQIFEIPLLPPSIPGIRIFNRIESALREAGARIQLGFPVARAETSANRVISVSTLSATSLKVWHAQEFILATGGVTSGGIVVESDREAHESVFQLPIFGLTHDGPGFSTNYFESHHFSRVGLRVDEKARPINVNGDAVFENLRAAGGILAGAEPWKEKSGEGIALATGFLAAESIIDQGLAPDTSINLASAE